MMNTQLWVWYSCTRTAAGVSFVTSRGMAGSRPSPEPSAAPLATCTTSSASLQQWYTSKVITASQGKHEQQCHYLHVSRRCQGHQQPTWGGDLGSKRASSSFSVVRCQSRQPSTNRTPRCVGSFLRSICSLKSTAKTFCQVRPFAKIVRPSSCKSSSTIRFCIAGKDLMTPCSLH